MIPTRPRNVNCPNSGPEAKVTRAGIMGSTSTVKNLFSPLGYYTQEQALTTMCNLLP